MFRHFSFRLACLQLTLPLALALCVLPALRNPLAAQAGARERTLYVSALDDKGEPVAALGADAFVIREDGVRREVLRVSRATEPIDIALLLDNSAAAGSQIVYMREALRKFVATMAPNNPIAVITLADRPTIATDYTNDTAKASEAVGRLFAMSQSGMTLLDGIIETARGLGRRETPRATIVGVITDGPEFTNAYSRDVIAALQRAQVSLNLVTVGQFVHSDEHGIRERSFLLDQGPRDSGGDRAVLLAPMGLDSALQKLARQLSSQYKVVYGRPQSLIPPEKTEVSSSRSGVTMRATPERGKAGA
jgi:VWFA-related protein